MNLSDVWQRIESHLMRERQDLLELLITPLDMNKTSEIRGRIHQIDELLESLPPALRASN
nr:MAG TPA: hypothetical protein [Caudoviricetes sp.]